MNMKKTIGFIAALVLTMSSMGVTASAADLYYYNNDNDYDTYQTAPLTAEEEYRQAVLSGNAAAERKAMKKLAVETCDPGYLKALKQQSEFEKNAGGGSDADKTDAEKKKEAALMKQSFNSTRTYVSYLGKYVTHNSAFDGMPRSIGIDVSEWQYDIDWNAVKNDGIDFAIIRLGYRGYGSEGTLCTDPKFYKNLQGAKNAGIKVGVYFFTEAITNWEAKEEAQYVLNVLNGTYLDMPVYYDIEDYPASYGSRMYYADLSKQEKTNLCRAFCDEINKNGYTAGVYSYRTYFASDVDGPTLGNEYPVWLADYADESPYTGAYHMWQFGSTAQVDGVQTGVDINCYYGEKNMGGKGTVKTVAKPSNVKGSGNTISWSKVDNATGYEVCRHDAAKGSYTVVGTTTGTSYTIKNPSADLAYCVRAYNNTDGNKVYSSYSDDVKLGSGTSANGSLTAELISGSVSLTWNKDPDADGYDIYRSKNDTEFMRIGTTTKLTYTDNDIDTNAMKYTYYVQSYKNGKMGKKTDYATVRFNVEKASAPTFVSCNTTSVSVSWKEMNGVSGYQLLMQNPDTGKYAVKGDVKTGSALNYTFSSLDAGTSYRFAVRAYIQDGSSKTFGEISNDLVAKTVPGTVSGLTATPNDTGALLSWNKTAGAEKYIVYRKIDSTYKKLGTVSGTEVNMSISGSAERQYCVAAVITQGGKEYAGAKSSIVKVKSTAVGTPKITSGSYADGKITLTWTKAANCDGYRVYKYNASTDKYESVKTISGDNNTSATISGIQSGITELFKVKAFRREEDGNKWSPASEVFSVKTLSPLPAPTNLYATSTTTSIKLTWDAVNKADAYNVYYLSGSQYTLLGEVSGTSCSIKSSGDIAGSFAVAAVQKSGSTKTTGAYSNTASIVKSPSAPTLNTASVSSDSIKLSWNVPNGITGVRIYMYNASTNAFDPIKVLSNKKSSLSIKGLRAGTSYKFRIKSFVRTGTATCWSKASAALTVKTSN